MFGVICNSPCFEARKLPPVGIEDNGQLPSSEESPVSSALPKGFTDGCRGYDARIGRVHPLAESVPSPGVGN
ncbi:hypothetical protein EUGRSUZ_L02141 [Eucalyptus grandis]|uniref:Uncharacterized protein n=1 Tax=Eucalyptus grandis TaxID=71139 RepID=A0A058ZSP7_EUCGR|nr:hypothetical protein EUGRSUZ_L02141 [Eucalyptus grandis]